MSKVGLVVLILGLVGVLLGGGVLLVSLLLPALTDGRTSWDEAMLGIIPGALLLSVSFVLGRHARLTVATPSGRHVSGGEPPR